MKTNQLKIKAVFFDFDGVLSDSKLAHDTAWLQAIKEILKVSVESLPSDKISGKAPRLIAKTLCELYGNGTEAKALLDYKNEDLNNNLNMVEPFNGVEAVFKLLKSKQIPFGVASNASKHFISQCLKNWNFNVDVCYGYQDYDNPKPNPEPYLKLAEFFNIKQEDYKDILVFEDSATGLTSALKAEMSVVHIKSYSKVPTEISDKVDYSFNSVFEAISLIE